MDKKLILQCLANSGTSSVEQNELIEITGLPLLRVILGIEDIVADGLAINGSTKDGVAIICNSKTKLAFKAGYYD